MLVLARSTKLDENQGNKVTRSIQTHPIISTSLFLLVGMQDLQEGLVRLGLVAEALLDCCNIGNGMVKFRRLGRQKARSGRQEQPLDKNNIVNKTKCHLKQP